MIGLKPSWAGWRRRGGVGRSRSSSAAAERLAPRAGGRGVGEPDGDDRVEAVLGELAQARGVRVLALVLPGGDVADVLAHDPELGDGALETRVGGVVERLVAAAADVV